MSSMFSVVFHMEWQSVKQNAKQFALRKLRSRDDSDVILIAARLGESG